MSLTKTVYQALAVAWGVMVFGGVIAVDQGLAEPLLSISDVPGGMTGGMAIGIVAALVGWLVIGSRITRIERAEWREAGREAGLQPADNGGDSDETELTGTIDGRTVSARYEKVNVESGE